MPNDSSLSSASLGPSLQLEEEAEIVFEAAVTGAVVEDAATTTPVKSTRKPTSAIAVVVLGIVASSLLLSFGLSSERETARNDFVDISDDLVERVNQFWIFFQFLSSLIYEGCSSQDPSPREGLRRVYEHMIALQIPFDSISCVPNVSHAERPAYENETAAFLAELENPPPYHGFSRPFRNRTKLGRRQEAPYYLPIHYVEPRETRSFLLDLDLNGPGPTVLRKFINDALVLRRPILTKPRRNVLPGSGANGAHVRTLALMHPGFPDKTAVDGRPRVGGAEIAVLQFFANFGPTLPPASRKVRFYLFDSTTDLNEIEFIGAVRFCIDDCQISNTSTGNPQYRQGKMATPPFPHANEYFEPLPETSLASILTNPAPFQHVSKLNITNREWTIVVSGDKGDFGPDILLLVATSAALLLASFLVAGWLYTSQRRENRMAQYQAQLEAEKAAIRLEAAQQTARNERELNDYIAHEVRNPLSAAISACSFVSTAVAEKHPLVTSEAQITVREDVHTITTSLVFINDLLRNMLDMHRAESNEMKMIESLTDVKSDILEPVAALLYRRDSNFAVEVDCPEELMIQSDKLRLKQIVLNLARNSAKFVEKGFIRLRAMQVEDNAVLFVEDSGPGVPEHKRKHMFRKFQDSLDSLQQGTGVGLAVCRKLIDLLEGEIHLDEDYHSGVDGCPGARFVIQLPDVVVHISPTHHDDHEDENNAEKAKMKDSSSGCSISNNGISTLPDDKGIPGLPDDLTVLFVDDDVMLRKLFARSISRHLPGWNVHSASSGEAALRLTEEQTFDIIFMDQYMASVDKQLLGTETVRALRANGVSSRICGLSANDLEDTFLKAGADAFAIKPFPYERQAIRETILRILGTEEAVEAEVEEPRHHS